MRTFLGVLVGPLLALGIAEAALRASPLWWEWLGRFAIGQPPRTELVLHRAREAVTAGEDVKVVILGSSVAAQDVDERVLGPQLGGPHAVVNLGLNASPLWNTAMLLPGALELQPEAIVLVCAPGEMGATIDPDAPRLFEPGVLWQVYDLRDLWADRAGVADRALRTASRWLRYRSELRGLLLLDDDRGGFEDPRDKTPVDGRPLADGVRRHADLIIDAHRTVDERNVRALRFMAKAAAEADIPLIVAVAPIHPDVQKLAPTRQLHEFYWREAQAEGFDLLDMGRGLDPADYPPTAFRDAVHLGHRGQQSFTAAVRDALASRGVR
ncbi:MAG: hypothetical protein D6798_00575 [Deltaproteobacteria bacterium]|nr:MAG: hypothetical protein D6798_00575 [Deltaproteobacteria bacterium]